MAQDVGMSSSSKLRARDMLGIVVIIVMLVFSLATLAAEKPMRLAKPRFVFHGPVQPGASAQPDQEAADDDAAARWSPLAAIRPLR